MAGLSSLHEIEESFFHCLICTAYFKEPKLLPCLHRYCKTCLEKVTKDHHGICICPSCSRECAIPNKGVDGFKTDYHMENMVEFKRIKFSFEIISIRDCIGCSNKTRVSAYCFKCKDFLCRECHNFHLTNKMVADHVRKLLSADDFERNEFSLQKYSVLKEPPNCHIHHDARAHKSCCTCNDLPVCRECVFSRHQGHSFHDIDTLSDTENNQIMTLRQDLKKCEDKFQNLIKDVEATNDTVNTNAISSDLKLNEQYRKEKIMINNEIETRTKTLETTRSSLIKTMAAEIHRLTDEHDAKVRVKETETHEEINTLERDHKSEIQKLNGKRDNLEKTLVEKKRIAGKQNKEKCAHVLKIKYVSKQIEGRLNCFSSTIKSIHATNIGWPATQCLPDIVSAYKRLDGEVDSNYRQLHSLNENPVGPSVRLDPKGPSNPSKEAPSTSSVLQEKQSTSGARKGAPSMPKLRIGSPGVKLIYGKASVIEIHGMKNTKQKIHSIASCGNRRIALTGYDSREYSFLSLINANGKRLKYKTNQEQNALPFRYCASLSNSRVLTVSKFNLISIFDSHESSFIEKNVSQIVPRWSSSWRLTSVATDPLNDDIYVGASNLRIYIFNSNLDFLRTLHLPKTVMSTTDIVVLNLYLLVCDQDGKGAYVVTRQDPQSRIVHEVNIPNLGGNEYCPISVCTDKTGFIFILWSAKMSDQSCCVCAKYSQDGLQLLKAVKLDRREDCITIINTSDNRQKLVAATSKSNKLFLYDLQQPRASTSCRIKPKSRPLKTTKKCGNQTAKKTLHPYKKRRKLDDPKTNRVEINDRPGGSRDSINTHPNQREQGESIANPTVNQYVRQVENTTETTFVRETISSSQPHFLDSNAATQEARRPKDVEEEFTNMFGSGFTNNGNSSQID